MIVVAIFIPWTVLAIAIFNLPPYFCADRSKLFDQSKEAGMITDERSAAR